MEGVTHELHVCCINGHHHISGFGTSERPKNRCTISEVQEGTCAIKCQPRLRWQDWKPQRLDWVQRQLDFWGVPQLHAASVVIALSRMVM
jgi:hypothetical protein